MRDILTKPFKNNCFIYCFLQNCYSQSIFKKNYRKYFQIKYLFLQNSHISMFRTYKRAHFKKFCESALRCKIHKKLSFILNVGLFYHFKYKFLSLWHRWRAYLLLHRFLNTCFNHRDKTRVQMPAKIFPHLKVKC